MGEDGSLGSQEPLLCNNHSAVLLTGSRVVSEYI